MNSYILSFTKKFAYFFEHIEISNIIYLHDEDDNERLDHVIFLEKNDGDVIGIYLRGMNPLISANRIYDLDDFNLFANYDELIECKENKLVLNTMNYWAFIYRITMDLLPYLYYFHTMRLM
ncbi:hypothetical protein [Paenibacillus radicis (ex Gao et al. 2016)]|uniref:Uncharacterized protein n=1 Tax=Paenibacillus radicis (ex Gao et al. 2016) TaxID=1737354 RepID=A0A917HLX0_9BACL|nr:hypothetical protein [Paenibacillus radicis (ex Gao et al. 2016)]GGG82928.1 hypothetical protein GCM10010918_45560 [Paenibacillus radicis (ex Gao et al. 2016)]